MKNNFFILLAVVSVFTISSCKKKVENCKLGKSYVSDGNNTPNPNTFFYYDNGNLQKITYNDQSKDTLVYNADTLIILTFDSRDSVLSVFTGILNGSRNVIAGTRVYYNYFGNVINTESYSVDYNTDGNLTLQTITDGAGTKTLALEYLSGNTASGTFVDGVNPDKHYVFFHNSVANKTGIDDLNGVFNPYFGKPSKNLLDSTHIISAGDTIRIQYSHSIDENEYVSQTIRTYLTPGVETKYFTYQYFDCD